MAVRGFVQGLVVGSLVAAGGLVVVSQVAGPVRPDAAVTPEAVPAPQDPVAPLEAEADAVEGEPAEAASADQPEEQTAAPDGVSDAQEGGAAGLAPVVPDPAAPAPEQSPAPLPQAPVAEEASAPAAPPLPPPSEAPGEALASAGQVRPPMAPATGEAPQAAVQPAAPVLPAAEGAPEAADLPPVPPLRPEEEALLLPLPEAAAEPPVVAVPADPTPEPGPQPAPVPEGLALGEGVLPSAPPLNAEAEGVVTGRLPRIGDAPAEAEAGPVGADPATLPPRARYARPFDNPAQKPLFAILLQDKGQEGVDRAELAALALPLSIVIDPLSEGAAERAAIWRAGGQEVVMAGTGIPEGAGPGDLEQSFQVLDSRLPEAVAVIDADGTAFQANRALAAQVVPILAEQGRGLVTLDQGLNAADQVARREGLAAAVVFRAIDSDGEASPVVRRYLDRAAFKAAQDGRVIVIGDLRPETVAGVLEWAVEGRASTVALAPLTALLEE